MISSSPHKRVSVGNSVQIFIAMTPVDFRKGHDGLAATVQNILGKNPFDSSLFIFRAKRGDRIKILYWDGTGLVLVYKRLESCNFKWPSIQDGVLLISRGQVEALFEGLDWRKLRSLTSKIPLKSS